METTKTWALQEQFGSLSFVTGQEQTQPRTASRNLASVYMLSGIARRGKSTREGLLL